jgi:recombination directionality factor gp3-like protein
MAQAEQQAKGPTRHRVQLPTTGQWPRAGKIRLGTATLNEELTTKYGREIFTPKKAEHFVVHEDESGITTAEAAAAFAATYGEEPRQLRFILVGDTPDECMEGAYRLYGANKLKIRCDGTTCDERTATGWRRNVPCICEQRNLAPDSRDRCTLTYTISLVLPDVAMPGIWQIDTGSEISSRRMAEWLDMIYTLRGGLRGIEGDLFLVPVSVQPEGRSQTSTVYVLSPQARGATVQQLLAGGGAVELGPGARAELPPPAADETHEPTLDRTGFAESRSASSLAHEGAAHTSADAVSVGSPDAPGGTEPPSIADQIRGLGERDKKRLRERRGAWRIQSSEPDGEPQPVPATVAATAAFIETAYPDHSDVLVLLDELDKLERAKAAEQGRLV